MKDGEAGKAAGVLSIGSVRDAAGRPQRPYILRLSSPACLTASDPEDSVKSTRTVHIFSTDEKVHASIAQFVGKSIEVSGSPFPAHTAHHHAPIVMDITGVTQR
jgi:hypothetical protein